MIIQISIFSEEIGMFYVFYIIQSNIIAGHMYKTHWRYL